MFDFDFRVVVRVVRASGLAALAGLVAERGRAAFALTFDFADFADFGWLALALARFAFVLLADFAAFLALRAGPALLDGFRFEAPFAATFAFPAALLGLFTLLILRAAVVGLAAGAAAFKRFPTTGVASSSPATRARAAPSDRAGADEREDGNAAPAADLLAFVFMAINVWGGQRIHS